MQVCSRSVFASIYIEVYLIVSTPCILNGNVFIKPSIMKLNICIYPNPLKTFILGFIPIFFIPEEYNFKYMVVNGKQ